MQENRNASSALNFDGRGVVCIDTNRVLDSCRDRDCFEDTRVYLDSDGESVINNATNVRLKSAKLIWAFVGLDSVPFNRGFYRVSVRYYVKVEGEGCTGMGRNQTFCGIAVLEKEVILYGGEGCLRTFSSSPENNFCDICNLDTVSDDSPVAVVETVEPIILGQKITDCGCQCNCCDTAVELPTAISGCLGGEICTNSQGPRLYVSFGIFSVIRILRPAQLLVQATDYSVPDKECTAATNDENPCALFRTMAFPENQFRNTGTSHRDSTSQKNGGCGCSGK
ncbi:MAG: hypothetical protein IJ515_02005 [Clostridia bacterium]|nr:hypothetical protein [Clostridia bacterium]